MISENKQKTLINFKKAQSHISNLLSIILVVLLLFSTIGVFMSMGMNSDGTMNHCVFMNMGMCAMTFSEHINLWQTMFSAIPQKAFFINVLMLISFAIALAIFRQYLLLLSFKDFICKFYYKKKRHLSFFDYLKESFSQGILKPKIYKLATI